MREPCSIRLAIRLASLQVDQRIQVGGTRGVEARPARCHRRIRRRLFHTARGSACHSEGRCAGCGCSCPAGAGAALFAASSPHRLACCARFSWGDVYHSHCNEKRKLNQSIDQSINEWNQSNSRSTIRIHQSINHSKLSCTTSAILNPNVDSDPTRQPHASHMSVTHD